MFLSSGALFGGGILVFDPSGKLLQMPVIILKNSPFNNFLIPGLILFSVLGLFPALIFYSLLKRPQWTWVNLLNIYKDMYWAWTFTLYVGFALIIWISVQTLMINSVHYVHTGYVFLGISIVLIALLQPVKQRYFQNGQQ